MPSAPTVDHALSGAGTTILAGGQPANLVALAVAFILGALAWHLVLKLQRWRRHGRRKRSGWSNYYRD